MAIPWINVGSSWLDAIAYDSGDLYIRFHDKKGKPTVTAHYADIPLETWTAFLEADSKGVYFHSSGLIHHAYTIIG